MPGTGERKEPKPVFGTLMEERIIVDRVVVGRLHVVGGGILYTSLNTVNSDDNITDPLEDIRLYPTLHTT